MSPRRVAVVGAGPSGLFAAQSLTGQQDIPVTVDLYDRLPTPYGLLRYGVAPDHPNIKAVATTLAKVLDSDAITFRGSVRFGADITREDLLSAYDAVIYAVGAAEDMSMGVPGEHLPGSRSGRQFVEWYGGHPDAAAQSQEGITAAATIGLGNVAVDIARTLVKDPTALEVTDMPQAVLDELHAHPVKDVYIIGRRGPQHASFTTVELRELLKTEGVAVDIPADVLEGIDESALDRRTKANVAVLREAAATPQDPNARARLHFRFWRRPAEVVGTDHVEGLVVEKTALGPDGKVTGTGETETLPVQLVLRAIGYRGKPMPGVPFDERAAVIPNAEGRVTMADGQPCPREYVVGWIKRGPVGVIGTNKSDAAQTVRHLLADLSAEAGEPATLVEPAEMLAAKGVRPTSFAAWLAIDRAEIARGGERGRLRTKIETWDELTRITGESAGTDGEH